MKKSLLCLAVLLLTGTAFAADWPTYRADAERSGYVDDRLPAKLSLAWIYRSEQPPQPAWPRDDRMTFDRAAELVVAGNLLSFGSSADGRVCGLDAETGETRWTFFTDAPVRFAPLLVGDEVYVVSDDGHLYCLAAQDGSLKYRSPATAGEEMILGNGRMVSRQPARGGPVWRDGVIYFGAGIWQADGIRLTALNPTTKQVVWQNNDAGRIYMAQPHGGAMAESGVSPQGYLVATADKLLVPTGRAVPAVFHRGDGKFDYYHLQANGKAGGTHATAAGGRFYNGGICFDLKSGELVEKLSPGNIAVQPNGTAVIGSGKGLRVLSVVEKTAPDRKGVPVKTQKHEPLWSLDQVDASAATIIVGNDIVCGGTKELAIIDSVSRQLREKHELDGAAYSLAAAGGRLYVSTSTGSIYCFDGVEREKHQEHRPTPRLDVAPTFVEAAKEIVRKSGVTAGFCVDLDCGNGDLALALAQQTELQIYALSPTVESVTAVRQRIAAAGLYGTRVTVHQGTSKQIPYGKYFADLVVSSQSLTAGPLTIDKDSPPRVLRPFGGVVCSGRPGEMQLYRRDALAKSGSWTHQYSDPGNSCFSGDELVRGELHALWYRDVDLEMPQRHGRGPAPVYHRGRMFVEGLDALRAVDAYNGRNLWEFALPGVLKAYSADHLSGTAITGSNLCLGGDAVYIHDKQRCYRLDQASGRKLSEFATPDRVDGKPGEWGYIAYADQLLFGSLVNRDHRLRYNWRPADMSELQSESATLFALDAETGAMRWRYDAQHSIRHNAIAVGAGVVYLIDRAAASEDQLDPQQKPVDGKLPVVKQVKQPTGTLVALDAKTGEVLWRKADAFGTMLVYSPQYDALVMGYQSTRFKLPSEVGGRLAAFRGGSGEKLWDRAASYVTRPFIRDYTIYAQGGAWDLMNGDERPFELKRSYGCGQIAAAKHLMLFRSATLGYQSLDAKAKVENFGGIRPGCWINALPVGGLVLVPDASAGCSCSYQNRSWMALEGKD
ncbi:MAG: PQQ-binding-like beta-propeller repeat protein [Planctomycetaceae bacterium]|nr:PQQ-binding-like beta-propeller repeat protein [Planctomycetaceae bacterium]